MIAQISRPPDELLVPGPVGLGVCDVVIVLNSFGISSGSPAQPNSCQKLERLTLGLDSLPVDLAWLSE